MMVMGYSKNQKQAMEFLKWFHSTEVYDKWFNVQKGFATGPTKQWENHKMWQEGPGRAAHPPAGPPGGPPGGGPHPAPLPPPVVFPPLCRSRGGPPFLVEPFFVRVRRPQPPH